ncbi:hypothetical protein ASG36_18515 [Geodermatophilus sp. Leaf369]|uniref:hypothetical protein n=1 Tax=Geodermatophilus sp. Leaf369 TaxID=1736354 RepID=UPI0006FB4A7E|nr:hypothetical protein [Geodermatophilus sp. Leaf369]KQS56985.1 hypothetical protein ASG36_18515 [Geodermatophilus sp. Leaf369]
MDRTADDRTSDDPVSPRLLLFGVLTPLLVGGFVPALAGIATVWLFCGLAALVVTSMGVAVRRGDPGEDGDEESVVGGHWWRLVDEDPNTAAARAGSWG